MPSDFLDLLETALSPELTTSETARVRSMLRGASPPHDAPWASGVPDIVKERDHARAESAALRERVAWLELSFKLLCDMLAEGRVVDGARLRERLRAIAAQVDAERRVRESEVTCVGCGATIARDEANMRVTGAFCERCHLGGKRSPPLTAVRDDAAEGGYRDAPQTRLVPETVTCVSCAASIPVSESYRSSRGALCAKCQLENDDE